MNNTKTPYTDFRIYCFLGLPGSGKGTQIELLAKNISARVISIGEEIRQELENADLKDPFYQQMKNRYDKGIPQPDEVAIDIVGKRLVNNSQNVIFDNFPFSKHQAELFFKICGESKWQRPELVVIKISADTSIRRVVYRKVCSDCGHIMINEGETICDKCGGPMISRSDDNIETVEQRIKNYQPRIEEVITCFRSNARIIEIDGSGSIEEVSHLIQENI